MDLIDLHEDSPRVFNYNLNIDKTKKNLCEGAQRNNYERENKKTCVNLIFNDGAFTTAVLAAISDLKSGPKHFIVGKESVERVSIESRQEQSGKHVDSKIVFKVNNEKIVIHVYNTKQKLTIQGKKHKWFVDSYLEPFLKLRILNSQDEINVINKAILERLSNTEHITLALDEESEVIVCDNCDFSSTNSDSLREHIKVCHSQNVFQGLTIISSCDDSVESSIVKSCDNCVYTSNSATNLREHIDTQHRLAILSSHENLSSIDPPLENDYTNESMLIITYNKCEKCSYTFKDNDEYKNHMSLHDYADYISDSLNTCRTCWSKVSVSDFSIQCMKCLQCGAG